MIEMKNCENCKYRKMRKSRGYPCMCCELLNPIAVNLKWEEEPPKEETWRNWCASCKHDDGDFCELEECCMYQQNADGTYNRDLPPTEYEEE